MALSTGQEHLAGAVAIIQEMLKVAEVQAGGDWSEVKGTLEGALASLEGVEETFFLKSSLCVYFTKQLLTAAEGAKRALGGDQAQLKRAVARLAKAASTLADKSQMRDGVTLT